MRVTMLLCDHAQVADNKLFINGGGWDRCSAPTPPHSVAILLSVPWDRTNVQMHYELRLIHEDGGMVQITAADGSQVPVGASGTFEVGRPSGLRPGTPISVPMALPFSPMALDPDTGYAWRLTIDGESEEDWSLPFRTMPPR